MKNRTLAEVESVFSSLGLPVIEKSIDEIRRSKESFGSQRGNLESPKYYHRTVISNGTNTASWGNEHNAELESGINGTPRK
jgi:hypothetical protein